MPREVLAKIEGLGCRLGLRPGGLRLAGEGELPPGILALIQEHRDGLLALLEEDARLCATHEASLTAGRILLFPPQLVEFLNPLLRRTVREDWDEAFL